MEHLIVLLALAVISAALTFYNGGPQAFVNLIFWIFQGVLAFIILMMTRFDNPILDRHEIDLGVASSYGGALIVGALLELVVELLVGGFQALREQKAREEAGYPPRPPVAAQEAASLPVIYDFSGTEQQLLRRCHRYDVVA